MSDHSPAPVERHGDVAVIGGSAAGLSAALQLARQRRSVIVVDAGEPRNAAAAHVHGYLGHEGVPLSELVEIARAEVRSYGGEILSDRAERVTRTDGGLLCVDLAGGHAVVARRVLAATGLTDELPEIDGLARHWGQDVVHCPFCHGFEVRDRCIVQVVADAAGLHTAPLWRQLSGRLTIVLHDTVTVDGTELDALRAAGVEIVEGRVTGVVEGGDGHVTGVELAGGQRIPAEAIAVGTRFRANAGPFEALGIRPVPHPSGLGDHLRVDATGATDVPGVHAAGNVTDPSQQVLQAAADGGRVGAMISFTLAHDDLCDTTRPSARQDDWDTRYGGEPIWSGNPNGSLVNEVSGLAAGRALDVGAGEGGDALWLAGRGWQVTASDISGRALARIAEQARAQGLDVDCTRVDATAPGAYPEAAYDLVSVQYPAIPRTPDLRAARSLLGAVAPEGTLLFVGHDPEGMRVALQGQQHSRPYDPDAYLRVDDLVGLLGDTPGWKVEVHDRRPRPAGSATDALHHHDVVLRARRTS